MSPVPTADYLRILPELILSGCGLLIMLVAAPARGQARGRACGILALLGTLAALASLHWQAQYPGTAFSGLFRVDGFTLFLQALVIAATAAVILLAMDYLPGQKRERGEFYALLLFATVGMGFMVGSVQLIMIFLGLEISSIASYILAGYLREDGRSTEAALKYLLLGSFATAFFLFGVAFIYGATGTTQLYAIGGLALVSGTRASGLILAAMALLFTGIAFKVSAAPFQVWTPDVYQGAPAPITGFLSAGPKAAAFAVLLRIFYAALHSVAGVWFWLVWGAAILSMCMGNFAALRQTNVKRLLAYSSIAQAGYVLVAFAALGRQGISAVLFYLAAYIAMNLGAFAVVAHLARRGERHTEIKDYNGLGFRYPFQAAALSLFLCSLIGVPLTAGFFGKLYIFESALHRHLIGLTIIALINSAVAAYYYLGLVVAMYMKRPEGEVGGERAGFALSAVLVACAVAVLWLGIFPNRALTLALHSASALLAR